MDIPQISINQNVIVLIVGLAGLGYSEMNHLTTLYWFSIVISFVMGTSVLISMVAYTLSYLKKKM